MQNKINFFVQNLESTGQPVDPTWLKPAYEQDWKTLPLPLLSQVRLGADNEARESI